MTCRSIPYRLAVAALLLAPFAAVSAAQEKAPDTPKPSVAAKPSSEAARWEEFQAASYDQSYKLRNQIVVSDQNEVLTALRNVLPALTKIFLVPSSNQIVVHAPKETQDQVAKLLLTLDVPRPRFRLIYTVTELDGTRKVGVQHFSLVVVSNQHGVLKEGSRIPIQAGYSTNDPKNSSIVYIDVGMNFDATLTEIQGGAVLKSKVEQTSIAPDSVPGFGGADPIIRQTFLEGTSQVVLNKPLLIGSLDVPNSTHHFDVEALVEPVN